jgi:hypothetical protein
VLGGGNWSIEQTMFPQLTQALGNELLGQVGQGVSPFNLSTQLPFGGTTQPGQLTAQANPLLQSLMSAYQGGQTNIPGFSALSQIANQGISALPEWQSMIQAQGQNIAQTQGNLQEQLGQTGNLAGTPYGNTMANFGAQTAAQQNALLGQLQQQNILQGQIPVAETLMGGAQQMGQYGQALNQQAIQNMLNEFIRTSPQYNPLLQAQYGMATSWDPALNRTTGGGLISGILGSLPNISYNPSTGGVTF